MLVVMIEGNLFAVKIPPHYKFVPSLSIVMQAEMAILNGKVIKSRFAHEKHEEVLALLLARYKAKEYKTVLISDVNTFIFCVVNDLIKRCLMPLFILKDVVNLINKRYTTNIFGE